MKKTFVFAMIFLFSAVCVMCSAGTSETSGENGGTDEKSSVVAVEDTIGIGTPKVREKCFIVVSKKDMKLTVYEATKKDTVMVARFDCCLGKNFGDKQKRGDMCTPEASIQKPFRIEKIENSSWWTHDFGDGRGSIKAYGNWFMRLSSPFTGIGIHGSTNNENSVPGRFSEGCIRLRDADIDSLKQNYAFLGMKVIIKGEDEGKLSFEN